MLLTGNIFSELNNAFNSALKKSEIYRLSLHNEFAAFYNNDYESICGYLREATLNNPFSEETLQDLRFRHVNVIRKIIGRITSGIFTKDPVIKLNDAACDMAVTIRGMREGWFTGHRLEQFFPLGSNKANWRGARKIINGLDKANLIAGYAMKFYDLLEWRE